MAAWLRRVADGAAVAAPADLSAEVVGEAIALLEESALYGSDRGAAGRSRYPARVEPDREGSRRAAELMKRAHLHGPLAAFDLLVELGHWDADENLELRRCAVPVEFSPNALDEAAGTAADLSRASSLRRWWGRRVYACAEDGGAGQAFSIRRTLTGFRVGIHLADPTHLISPQGALQRAAAERGTTLQLPERTIPMLPDAVGAATRFAAAAGARAGRRPTLTVSARFDRSWRLRDFDLTRCRVRPARWMQPDAGASARASDPWFRRLHELSLELRQRRRDRGELVMAEPEVQVKVADAVEIDLVDPLRPATLIAGELLLLAQELAARFCAAHGLGVIHRLTPAAPERVVEADTFDAAAAHAQRKMMSRPSLQVAAPSEGIVRVAIGRPLDRVEDLLGHQQLNRFLATGAPAYTAADLDRVLDDTRWARDGAASVTRWSRRYWLLKRLESAVGSRVDAVVLERAGTGLVVELSDCRLIAFIPGGREAWAQPGDAIGADLSRVSARRDQLQLQNPSPR